MASLMALAVAIGMGPVYSSSKGAQSLYLGGVLDLPLSGLSQSWGAQPELATALSVGNWIIHVGVFVGFLLIIEYCWQWGDVVKNPAWKGLGWGVLLLQCGYALNFSNCFFYNSKQLNCLVPILALSLVIGNSACAYAALRIALSNGWKPKSSMLASLVSSGVHKTEISNVDIDQTKENKKLEGSLEVEDFGVVVGHTDYAFLLKFFTGCAIASYILKYTIPFLSFPYEGNLSVALSMAAGFSALNALKCYKGIVWTSKNIG